MKDKTQILQDNGLLIDLLHNKAMTKRVHKVMEEYAQQYAKGLLRFMISKKIYSFAEETGEWNNGFCGCTIEELIEMYNCDKEETK